MQLIYKFKNCVILKPFVFSFSSINPPKIPLNKYEEKLFDDLLNIVDNNKLGTTLRVAGGWVRDKVSVWSKLGNEEGIR